MDLPVTHIELVDWFLRLLADHAYLVVFLATTAENVFVIGSVTPGETIVMAAGFVSIGPHPPHPFSVFLAAVLGSLIGTNVSYVIGRRGGRPVLEKWGRRIRMTPARIAASEAYFEKHGPKTVFIARFAMGFKNYVGLIAGISRMRVLVFETYVLAGAVVYSAVMVTLGYFLGENWGVLVRVASGIGYAGLLALLALLASVVLARRRRRAMAAARDSLEPERVDVLVTSPFWSAFRGGGVTGSTNDDLKALAAEGAPEGTVVLADRQTAGRGRLGRTWSSPEGGAYFSVLLRPSMSAEEAAPLPLAVALGVAIGLEALGAEPRLKWPNDVYLGDGKVAGVLVETAMSSGGLEWAVAGCGVNVRPPRSPEPGASYLEEHVGEVERPEVVAACLDGISETLATLVREGFGALLPECERRLMLTGREVVVRDRAGEVLAQGRAIGLDEAARLVVETPEGETVRVALGDVTLR